MPGKTSLEALIRAIGRLDLEAADRLLTAEPALARQTLGTAASRDKATSWYFNRIGHYAADGIPGSSHWNPGRQAAVIELLARAGADVNARTKDGVTPLHRAVRTRCSAAVAALLAAGADARIKNGSGSTAQQLATGSSGRGGSGSREARAERVRILELLEGVRG
jgi:hypothetical protein